MQRVLDGESPEEVIRSIGYQRRMPYHWLAQYHSGGFEALQAHKSSGGPPKLDGSQMMRLYNIIKDETPEQYTFDVALWTIEIIREVIKRLFRVIMSGVSVWRMLTALGVSAQRPRHAAYQQHEEAVKDFLKKETKKCGAAVYWGDESTVRSDYHRGTTWDPQGKMPVLKTTGVRFSVNMVSAVSSKGHLRFMVTDKTCTIPVFLIVDGHPVHKSRKVKEYVENTEGRLRLFYLSGYSPELNPDETVWSYVKNHVVGKEIISGPEQFLRIVKERLYLLMQRPSIVSALFRKPSFQYISVNIYEKFSNHHTCENSTSLGDHFIGQNYGLQHHTHQSYIYT